MMCCIYTNVSDDVNTDITAQLILDIATIQTSDSQANNQEYCGQHHCSSWVL